MKQQKPFAVPGNKRSPPLPFSQPPLYQPALLHVSCNSDHLNEPDEDTRGFPPPSRPLPGTTRSASPFANADERAPEDADELEAEPDGIVTDNDEEEGEDARGIAGAEVGSNGKRAARDDNDETDDAEFDDAVDRDECVDDDNVAITTKRFSKKLTACEAHATRRVNGKGHQGGQWKGKNTAETI